MSPRIAALVLSCSVLCAGLGPLAADETPRPSMFPMRYVGKVNINTASVEQLSLLPGIGTGRALGIIAYRMKRPFQNTRELLRIRGVGFRLFRRIEPHVTTEGDTTLERVQYVPHVEPETQAVPEVQRPSELRAGPVGVL